MIQYEEAKKSYGELWKIFEVMESYGRILKLWRVMEESDIIIVRVI